VSPHDAVEIIYDAGGIPVIAHPHDLDIAEPLIKELMKDCDDKKNLIEEEKNKVKLKEDELSKIKLELDELKLKTEKEREDDEKKIKEAQELASKNVPMLTKKFKELTIEIGTLKKELKNSEAKK